ncbi:translocation/assembly module TamB domain-containing protein [Flaviaesturariibacter amylovorans]|uniref:Translocation/assembly module TamB domain-containing protein n=1 Tax=Flaviaesturariibacter amylovorans TaxID=1084520 RepID=A0ABP8GJ69_9BACT
MSTETLSSAPAPAPRPRRTVVQRVARVLLKTVLFLLLFVVLVILFLLTPPGQQFATNRVERFLENKLKTRVEIGSIRIGLPRKVVLENIYVEDRTKDTLLYGGTVRANVELLKLFNNEVTINDLQIENMTAKVKRVLPDTVYNFQFVVDAFMTQQAANPDTAAAPVMKMAVKNLGLKNINVVYKDVLTGNDMNARIGNLTARMDTFDVNNQRFGIPSLAINGLHVRYYQTRPLTAPAINAAPATAKAVLPRLDIGQVRLRDIHVDYGNETSAFYTKLDLGNLLLDGKDLDLDRNRIHLARVRIDDNNTVIRLGRKQAARDLANAVEAGADSAVQQDYLVRVDHFELNGNRIRFDNDNTPRTPQGIDFAHFDGSDLNLAIQNLVLNKDSIAGRITRGSLREKSGFVLNSLQGDLLYANNQAYIKDLDLQTPGTHLKRYAVLQYTSQDALVKQFEKTVLNISIEDSRVQVKDILAFAPQLRSQPAFANPNAVWTVDLRGSGTMDRLNISSLRFNGLRNTSIDASGTLAGLSNPNAAGGTFTIRRLHTSQTDLALFTGGKRLSNAQMDLPETFTASGTLSGNMANINANMNVATAYGNVGVNGNFANLTSPAGARYNAVVRTRSLRLDRILRGAVPVGALTTDMRITGTGFTPETMNARFNGTVSSVVYNKYNYRNIRLDGSLNKNSFVANTDIRDPNIDLTLKASGSFGANTRFKVNGFIDSIKTGALGLTAQPLTFRGRINADVRNMNADFLDADVLITEALFVSGTQRAPIDSLSFVSGQTGSEQFMRVRSNFLNADLNGQYRFSDLGFIIQNNIQPYFSTDNSYQVRNVRPYDIRFKIDAVNSPVLAAFVPGFDMSQPLRAEGTIATGRGLNATVDAPALAFGGNSLSGLGLKVTTTADGLQVSGDVAHFVSGTMDIYNTRVAATIRNNTIDFNLGVNDKGNKPKYRLSGLLTQPSAGTYTLSLRPDSLLLNYELWSVAANNGISISPNSISANNFVLSRDGQQLALQSTSGAGGPLNVTFTDFRLGTITGFLRADSLLADGRLNGTATFQGLPKNPLFTSDLRINDLSFRKDTIGNVTMRVSSAAGNRYIADVNVTGKGNDFGLNGSLTQQAGGVIGLDLDLAIRRLELRSLQGALADFVTSANGNITGGAKISGTTAAPKVNGTLNFNQASISTLAIGGPFTIDNEKLAVTEEGFRFDNFSIRDSLNNPLTIDGTVRTSNFINYRFDLDVNARDFMAVNTQKKTNSLYYGKMNITTRLHVGGTEANPVVDGNIAVNQGTAFTIVVPQREPGIVEREGVVQFVDFSNPGVDSFFMALDTLNNTSIKGFDVAVNIDINKEATFNVIVDVASGDLLNLKGTGNLTAGVDPSGKITLTGTYVIDEGGYQFALNFLRRRFILDKGSRITWLGEPTAAELEVTGRYVANTAPLDLVEQQIAETTQRNFYLQKLPFQVLLYLRGALMKPDLTFDIQLPPGQNFNVSGDVLSTVQTRLTQLRSEPTELNKQVFAVLLLNRFVGDNPFSSNGGGFNAGTFARTSVSKLMTEQLNNLAAGLIQGVDLNFDVASSDDYTTGERRARTDLNVGLSKRLLNDRLTVTVGSNFQLEGPQQNNNSGNNIAGNIQVNYQLSRDGRYMLRFYRRNDYEGYVDGYVVETGLGFIISVEYNRFREIWQARRVRRDVKRKEKEAAKEQQPPKEQTTETQATEQPSHD